VSKKIIFALLLCAFSISAATQIVLVDRIRGEYELNFGAVYEIPIYPDIETMVALPPGYKITLAIPGSPDFVSVSVLQNTIYISRPVDHEVETNVVCHVITPEGLEEKLVIRCVGPRKSGVKVLAVQFTNPNSSETNRTIEAMKARYSDQLSAELSDQEKKLTKTIQKESMGDLRYFFVNSDRKDISEEYKGAEVLFDGMVNSKNNTYVYFISTVKNGDCDIVTLESVVRGNARLTPDLVGVKQLSANEYYYCYSIPQIQIPKKKMKIKFEIKIWSKIHTMSIKVS
jgi:hypothetical protein